MIAFMQFSMVVKALPRAWNGWQMYRDPFERLNLIDRNFLPYTNKTAFPRVKEYNHCVMKVYRASVKFGEITPDNEPFVIYEINYDENGRVTDYIRKEKDKFGSFKYIDECIYERDGDLITTERYYSNGEATGCVEYKYDNRNRLTTIDLLDSDNHIYKKTKYVYGSNGQITRYEYDKDGRERCASIDMMDAKGRLIKQTYKESGATIVETVTYNEKGFVEKINCSETHVYNGQKKEEYKGKFFDEYAYRYDEYGNITDRLCQQCHPLFKPNLEWVKFEYSYLKSRPDQDMDDDETEVVEAVEEDYLQNSPAAILTSSNPDDYCVSLKFDELSKEDCDDCEAHSLTFDVDGENEKIYFYQKATDGCGLRIEGPRVLGRISTFLETIDLTEKTIKDCVVSIMLHDFDNDGKTEVVVACSDLGLFVKGIVLKWIGSSSFKSAGEFFSSNVPVVVDDTITYFPYINGNTIITKVGIIGGDYKQYIYKDGELRKPE